MVTVTFHYHYRYSHISLPSGLFIEFYMLNVVFVVNVVIGNNSKLKHIKLDT